MPVLCAASQADKVEGKKKYGVKLGRLHEVILVILSRICNYKLKSQELLEFVGGDLGLGLFLIASVVKVKSIEASGTL